MQLDFEKWQACQNDFIVIWLSSHDIKNLLPSLQRQATNICSREGLGIGADGILCLETENRSDIEPRKLHIVNSNGSLANNCGNGLRCAALSYYDKFYAQAKGADKTDLVELHVAEHNYVCEFITFKGSSYPLVSVNMGRAQLNEENLDHNELYSDLRQCLEGFYSFEKENFSVLHWVISTLLL